MKPTNTTTSRRRQPRRAMYEVNSVAESSPSQSDPWAGEFDIADVPAVPAVPSSAKSFPAPPPPMAHFTSRRTSTPLIPSLDPTLGPTMAHRVPSIPTNPSRGVPSTDDLTWADQINVADDFGWDDPSNDIVISPVLDSRIDASDTDVDKQWSSPQQPHHQFAADLTSAPLETSHSFHHDQDHDHDETPAIDHEIDHEIDVGQNHHHDQYSLRSNQSTGHEFSKPESQDAHQYVAQDEYDGPSETVKAQFPEFEYQNEFDHDQHRYASQNQHDQDFGYEQSTNAYENELDQELDADQPQYASQYHRDANFGFDYPAQSDQNEYGLDPAFDQPNYNNQTEHDQNFEFGQSSQNHEHFEPDQASQNHEHFEPDQASQNHQNFEPDHSSQNHQNFEPDHSSQNHQNFEPDQASQDDQNLFSSEQIEHQYTNDEYNEEHGGLQALNAEDISEQNSDLDWMHQESPEQHLDFPNHDHQATGDTDYQMHDHEHMANTRNSWENLEKEALPDSRGGNDDHVFVHAVQEGESEYPAPQEAFAQDESFGEGFPHNNSTPQDSIAYHHDPNSAHSNDGNLLWDEDAYPAEDYAIGHENADDRAHSQVSNFPTPASVQPIRAESSGIEQHETHAFANPISSPLPVTNLPVDDFFSELEASPAFTTMRTTHGSEAITEPTADIDAIDHLNFDNMSFEQSLVNHDQAHFASNENPSLTADVIQAPTRLPMRNRLSGLDEKFKSLDLDDDLMMDDDDFLDEMPLPEQPIEQVSKPSQGPTPKAVATNKYQPSQLVSHHNIYAPPEQPTPAHSLPAKPAANIYDFPDSFVPPQAKPAKRTQSSKYAAPQIPQAPPSLAPSLTVRRDSNNSVASSQPGQPARQEISSKPFYEELPMPLPIPTQKARRVASIAPPQPIVTPALSQPPLINSAPRAPPANPYTPAAAPPQINQTPIGLVPPPQLAQAQQGLMPQPLSTVNQQAPPAKMRGSVSNSKYAPPRRPDLASAAPPQNPYAPSYPSLPNPQSSRMMPQSPRQVLPPIGNQSAVAQMGQPPMGQPPMGQPPMGQPPMMQQYGQSPLAQNAVLSMVQPPMGQQYGHVPANQQLGVPSSVQSAPRQSLGSLLPQPSIMPGRKSVSNPRTSAGSQASPYVPNAGPYAPINHHKHSRASSLVGAKGKEVNPYAPLLPTVNSTDSLGSGPGSASLAVGPGPLLASHRARGLSAAKSVSLHKSQSASKIPNPEALSQRQFPIFNWNASSKVVSLIPKVSSFSLAVSEVTIRPSSSVISDAGKLMSFPGPLSKSKTRKKDVEKWLEESVAGRLASGQGHPDDVLMDQVLQCLVKHDADVASPEYAKDICAVLNPSVNYSTDALPEASSSLNIAAKAFKLDTSGINTAFGLVLMGQTERALDFAIARSDWAFALVIANFSGPAVFARVVADYARINFPFQKSGNKVHHFMPLLLKVMSNNIDSVMEDLNTVSTEGDYAALHWRELVALILISTSPKAGEFLSRFAQFLAARGYFAAAHICLILTATPLSPIKSASMSEPFASVGLALQTEVYEFALALASNSTMLAHGLPHLLLIKLKHACLLADCGLFQNAQRYGDYVNACIKSAGSRSPFVSPQLLVEFQRLAIRVSEGGNTELSWLGSKMSKVNLNSVWFQLDKFIGGDESSTNNADTSLFSKFSPSLLRNASVLDFSAANHKRTPQMPKKFENPDARMVSPGQISSNATTPKAKPKLNRMLSTASVSSGRYLPAGQGIPAKQTQLPIAVSRSTGSVNVYAEPISREKDIIRPGRNAAPSEPETKIPAQERAMPPPATAQRSATLPSFISSAVSSKTVASSVNSDTTRLPVSDAAQYTESRTEKEELASSPTLGQEQQDRGSFKYSQPSPMHSDLDVGEYPQHFKPHMSEKIEAEQAETSNSSAPPASISEALGMHAPEIPALASLSRPDVDSSDPNDRQEDAAEPLTMRSASNHAPDDNLSSKSGPRKSPAVRSRVSPGANPYAPSPKADGAGATSSRFAPGGRLSTSKYAIPEGAKPAVGSDSPVREVKMSARYDGLGFDATEKNMPNAAVDRDQHPIEQIPRVIPERTQSRSASPVKGGLLEAPKMPIPTRGTQITSKLRGRTPYIDESFNDGDDVGADESMMSRNDPLVLNRGVRKSSLYPYPNDHAIGHELDHGFSEFPIPGSPELTTRANSVMGRPLGLYSSRLSQCQQSEMYQNYEVQDDTVDDYVPIEEDEDEDDDAHLPPVLKPDDVPAASVQKKSNEDKSALASTKSVEKNEGSEKGSQKGWFNWRVKDDGKPKPTRAHLGNESPFYYDEKHKRWLDKNKPVEEQLVSAAPPPPPSMKKTPGPGPLKPNTNGTAPNTNAPPTPGMATPASHQADANQGAPPSAGGVAPPAKLPSEAPTPKPSLANAGIDDLLSLTGSNVSIARKPANAKRSARRGYINMMEQ